MSTIGPKKIIGSSRYKIEIIPKGNKLTDSLTGEILFYDGRNVEKEVSFNTFDGLLQQLISYWENKLGTELNTRRFSFWLSEYFEEIDLDNSSYDIVRDAVSNIGKGISLISTGQKIREAKVIHDYREGAIEHQKKEEKTVLPTIERRKAEPVDDTVLKPSQLFGEKEEVTIKREPEPTPQPTTKAIPKPSVDKSQKLVRPSDYRKATEGTEPLDDTLLKPTEYLKKRDTVYFAGPPEQEQIRSTTVKDSSEDENVKPSQLPAEKKISTLLPPKKMLKEDKEKDTPISVKEEPKKEEKPIVRKLEKPKKEKVITQELPKPTMPIPYEKEVYEKEKPKPEPKPEPKPKPEPIADKEAITDLTKISGIGESTAESLKEAGFNTVKDIADANIADLTKIKGIGKATATKYIERAKKILE